MADLLNISSESKPEKQENIGIPTPGTELKEPPQIFKKIKEIIPHKKVEGITKSGQLGSKITEAGKKAPLTEETIKELNRDEIRGELLEYNENESYRGASGTEEIMGDNQDKFLSEETNTNTKEMG